MSVNKLGREYLKSQIDVADRRKKRRALRSERQQTRIALAQAVVGLVAVEKSIFDGLFWLEKEGQFARFDDEVNDFVVVELEKLKDRETPLMPMAEDEFEGFVHPVNLKDADPKWSDGRKNTVRHWLRSQIGLPWASVYSRLAAQFNHGAPFLSKRNVREFGCEVEAADPEKPDFDGFYLENGMLRYEAGKKSPRVATEPPKVELTLAQRLATKAEREKQLKQKLEAARFATSRRKAKRMSHGSDKTREWNRKQRLHKKYEKLLQNSITTARRQRDAFLSRFVAA